MLESDDRDPVIPLPSLPVQMIYTQAKISSLVVSIGYNEGKSGLRIQTDISFDIKPARRSILTSLYHDPSEKVVIEAFDWIQIEVGRGLVFGYDVHIIDLDFDPTKIGDPGMGKKHSSSFVATPLSSRWATP